MPVTLVTGFLEGGKTTAVKKILERGFGDFTGKTILIDCEEEGIETYDPDLLRRRNVTLIDIDGPFHLNKAYFKIMEEAYHPEQVIIEYGGMFRVSYLDGINLPKRWKIVRQLTVFDGGVFAKYLENLKPSIEDMIKYSNIILFNRCEEKPGRGNEADRISWKEYLHSKNPKAEIVFEDTKGKVVAP
ncbi:MAG: hypothetical protein LKM41_12945 [Lachnospiraceae bacterium]|nr:hypothetical protein [Lachnospiraceae bacterium]